MSIIKTKRTKVRLRAKRTEPFIRRIEILESAIYLAEKIGHLNITRAAIAQDCKISGATVARYFPTIEKLQQEVYKRAIRSENVSILRHCLSIEKCKMPLELKRKTIAFLISS
jgi:AcrR family transcriptional regulator